MKDRLTAILAKQPKKLINEIQPQNMVPPVPAGVLIPIYKKDDEYFLVFTLRTDLVEHHKGQISFPGGAFHPGDGNLLDTALRESFEEIGLWPADVQVVGELDDLITNSNFQVTPFVGFVPYPYTFHHSEAEVAEIIHTPLSMLLDKRFYRQEKRPDGLMDYYYNCYGYIIWGVTARILKPFLDIITSEGLFKQPGAPQVSDKI